MKSDAKSQTGRIGVAAIQLIFQRLGWIFREQTIEDYGIDAHVEIVDNSIATGELIAVQIKSGDSYFKEKTNEGIVFRGNIEHLEYWQNHSLPVIIVLYDNGEDVAYWQAINNNTVQKTNKAWKVIIPFEQKIDALALERIQQFSKKITATNEYTILYQRDVSHIGAKRYTANILLSKEYVKPDIIEIARKITTNLKTSKYYRNDKAKSHWEEEDAHVIWLFIYLSLEDADSKNWICKTQWICKKISPEFTPLKIDGEDIGDGIIIDWNKNYIESAIVANSYRLAKEDYLDMMHKILNGTKSCISQARKLTAMFDQKQKNEASYISNMFQLETQIDKFYFQAIRIGAAPIECSDLSQCFQSLMATSHNITLFFSEKGLEIWEGSNRYYLMNQAIEKYEKELLRLEFELEKIY
jgi:hypothetical protein